MKRPELKLHAARAATVAVALLFTGTSEAEEPRVRLQASVGSPLPLGGRQTAYLKVGLEGFTLDRPADRPPVNLAIVLDRSSSMDGDKIEKAKEAALLAVDRLGAEDVLSIVAYDSGVEVLVPAAPLRDREGVRAKIRSIRPGGSTALFAGVARGIEEIRKYLESGRVKRVILLSDGQANVGPSSPNELGRLGVAAKKEGIAITTVGLGLGYNEDLMAQLAQRSDGNHAFAATPEALAKLFDLELGDVLSIVAQEVAVKVALENGVRPVRVLNREAEITGQDVFLSLNQLYSRQEKFVLLEVEVTSPAVPAAPRRLGTVEVSYANVITGKTDRLSAAPVVEFARSTAELEAKQDRGVMVAVAEALAADTNRRALALRDEGKVDDARRMLLDNSSYLQKQAEKYKSKRLESYGRINFDDSNALDGEAWLETRKRMRKTQHEIDTQQAY